MAPQSVASVSPTGEKLLPDCGRNGSVKGAAMGMRFHSRARRVTTLPQTWQVAWQPNQKFLIFLTE